MIFKHDLPVLEVVDRVSYLLRESSGKRVLHLGAVDYDGLQISRFHQLLTDASRKTTGIDIDRIGIEAAKARGISNIIFGDVESPDAYSKIEDFDLIIASEILEHLQNLGNFLACVRDILKPGKKMIITTPNALCLHRYIYSLLFRQEYVHPDHIAVYSYHNLRHFLETSGFTIIDSKYYTLGRMYECIYGLVPTHATGLIFVISYESHC